MAINLKTTIWCLHLKKWRTLLLTGIDYQSIKSRLIRSLKVQDTIFTLGRCISITNAPSQLHQSLLHADPFVARGGWRVFEKKGMVWELMTRRAGTTACCGDSVA